MNGIDKKSYIPYYVQIKHELLDRIRRKQYAPGHRLPSEQRLAVEFDVTRITLRKALDELRREGIIRTERGKGSVVSKGKIEQSLETFYRFGREIGGTGSAAESKLISLQEIDATEELALRLEIPERSRIHRIVRVRSHRNEPLILEHSFVPVDIAPSINKKDMAHLSIYDILEKQYGHVILKAKEYLLPRISDEYESGVLGIEVHSPVFQTERMTHSDFDRIIEFRRSVIRGDRIVFSTELY